jgi:endonuclease-3
MSGALWGLHTPSEVVRALRRRYPPSPGGRADPFQTLIATVLSQRTREERTAEAAAALFARYPDARSLAAAKASDVERRIRPAGFFRQKAPTIIEISRRLMVNYGGMVPCELEQLLGLPGVGRKTANCVLVFAFGVPAIPVDTHVHRISNRLGWVRTRTPGETEDALMRALPKRYWMVINELFVLFGREICRPIGPRCSECPLAKCPSRGRLREGPRKGKAYIPGFESTLLGGLGKALARNRHIEARSRTSRMPRTSVRGASGPDSFLKPQSSMKPRTSVRGAQEGNACPPEGPPT